MLVKRAFTSYITAPGKGSTGSLPPVSELKRFLAEHNIFASSDKSSSQKLVLLRTKIFNDRKTFRMKNQFDEFWVRWKWKKILSQSHNYVTVKVAIKG